jgi:hypothetical protein
MNEVESKLQGIIGKRIELADQFTTPVIVESIDAVIDNEILIKIRASDGTLKDAQLSFDDVKRLFLI